MNLSIHDDVLVSKPRKLGCTNLNYFTVFIYFTYYFTEPRGSVPRLLIADFTSVKQLHMDGKRISTPVILGKNIITIDFDHRNHSACWVNTKLWNIKAKI